MSNLPPGCTMAQIEAAYGWDRPCEVCGLDPDNCICPECPICGYQGDPKCYAEHGLVRTEEQIERLTRNEEQYDPADDYFPEPPEDTP